MSKKLSVYLHDRLVGHLGDVGNARLEFSYVADYLALNGSALSNSLPLRQQPFSDDQSRPFFSGLLPDDQELDNLARYLKVSKNNVFKLLALVGGECAGAVSFFDDDRVLEPESNRVELSEAQLEKILLSTQSRPMMGGDDQVRLSLAGARSKLAVVIDDHAVYLSSLNNLSTHILKPPTLHFAGLVQNEYVCMQLAKAIGISVPESTIRAFGNTQVYQITRYDRVIHSEGVHRLHQEDFCQALAIAPENKYESEGGPSFQNCVDLVLTQSSRPALDYQQLLDRTVFNYLIGNNDAHAKNFSMLYKNGKASLAPAYDLVSTAVYPALNDKLAMKIGGRNKAEDLQRRHWERLVPATKTAQRTQQDRALAMCRDIDQKLSDRTFKNRLTEYNHPIIDDVIELIKGRVDRLNRLYQR